MLETVIARYLELYSYDLKEEVERVEPEVIARYLELYSYDSTSENPYICWAVEMFCADDLLGMEICR